MAVEHPYTQNMETHASVPILVQQGLFSRSTQARKHQNSSATFLHEPASGQRYRRENRTICVQMRLYTICVQNVPAPYSRMHLCRKLRSASNETIPGLCIGICEKYFRSRSHETDDSAKLNNNCLWCP